MTASILQASGYRVGLYTSPHLSNFRERIRVLDSPSSSSKISAEDTFPDMISLSEADALMEELKPFFEQMRSHPEWGRLSYFEVLTAMAFYHFHKSRVDFAVLETGLGGRLDATNVVDSLVAVLTPISLEHTDILGTTLSEIAEEKAKIIKTVNQKVVIAHQADEVKSVFEQQCRQFDIKPRVVGYNLHYQPLQQDLNGQSFDFQGKTSSYQGLFLSLLGKHQLMNAAVTLGVTEALKELGVTIPEQSIRDGLKSVFWPGRLEMISVEPTVILDCAHDAMSFRILRENIQELFTGKKVTLVIGVSMDKNRKAMCQALMPIVDKVIWTKAQHPRAYNLEEKDCDELFEGRAFEKRGDIHQAMKRAWEITDKNGLILVTGSVFLVSEARELCTNTKV